MSDHPTRGRPRRAETDERVMRAAVELLREKGPAGVSIEAVATRSGVARTTIYRRFDSRRELIEAAIGPVVDRPLPPPDLALEDKVRWVLEQVVQLFETGLGRGGVAALINDADPDFTGALRRALAQRLDDLRAQIQSDIDAGQLAAHVDSDALVGLLLGAYLGELLRHGSASPRGGWVEGTVDLLARAVAVSPTEA